MEKEIPIAGKRETKSGRGLLSMDKLFKVVGVIMVLMLIITLASCTETTTETSPPPDNQPAEQPPDPPFKRSADYHIGLVTLHVNDPVEESKYVGALIAKYGKVENGGMIKHVVLPSNYSDEQELVISLIGELANDPLMKAVIVNQGIQGTAYGFQKIRENGRDDIILLTNMPQDDPETLSKAATVIVDEDNVLRGYYDILRAKKMGATTFVFMSFPRHMGVYDLARRKAIYEEACKDLGIEFVFETVPDPATSDLGTAGAQQFVYDMMPHLVGQYGKDAVYFTTNTALHEPIIKSVLELGALFVDQDYMTPLIGFPDALNFDLSAAAVGEWPDIDWTALVKKMEEDVVAKGAAKRVGCWPFSYTYAASFGIFEIAMNMIEEKGTSNMQNNIVKAFQTATPGCNWMAGIYTLPDGRKLDNYYLLTMDTYIFGQGYSSVFSEPFPEKYYSITPERNPPSDRKQSKNGDVLIEAGVLLEYSGLADDFVIPADITAIAEWAFWGCKNLRSITIPKGVLSIGDYAFYNCSDLISVTILGELTEISKSAFFGCEKLKTIKLSTSIKVIKESAFQNCYNLESITIPNNVTSIGEGAFFNCYGLKSITIPNSVTSIERFAFNGCSSLEAITLPTSITKIGSSVFSGCSSLKSITIPNSVIYIDPGAFNHCSSLEAITLPNSVIHIGSGAFNRCSSLEAITIPNSVTNIDQHAFADCSSLKSIIIPNSVTNIGFGAFKDCYSLKSITIPNSVTNIGWGAFEDCSSLKSIIIPNSVTSIVEQAFSNCSSLESITIPSSVTSIGEEAFNRCDNLIIYCSAGSYAEEYAKNNSIQYVIK